MTHRALLVAALLVGAGLSAACRLGLWAPGRVVASDGTTWKAVSREAQGEVETRAAVASAAHDIPCARAETSVIDVITHDDTKKTVVTQGCGARLTYDEHCDLARFPSGDGWDCAFLLIGRVDLEPRQSVSR